MERKDIKEEIRGQLGRYVLMITKPSPQAGRDMYACPLCGSGNHGGSKSDGAFHVSGHKWYCHSCQQGGDIFNLYAMAHRMDVALEFPAVIDGLRKELGITGIADGAAHKAGDCKSDDKSRFGAKDPDRNRMEQIEAFSKDMAGSPAEEYLHGRGLLNETIKKYKLGYNSRKAAVVIPYPGTDYYTERLINPLDGQRRYDNLPGEAPIFMVMNSPGDIVFITEGQIDALSLLQCGANNVIASHYPNKIGHLLDTMKISGALIMADRDKTDPLTGKNPGKDIADRMAKTLDRCGVINTVVYPPVGYKDCNDMLQADPSLLRKFLAESTDRLYGLLGRGKMKDCTISEYLRDQFDTDIAYFKQYRERKTGFSNVDQYLTLYPGLACLTGATSLGKTTFCVQLADQLIAQGEYVLMFPLEQPRIEIVTKSLARRLYKRDPLTKITNIEIKNGATSTALEAVRKEYEQEGCRCRIIDCDFRTTADWIVGYVENFIQETGIRPVVVIDYLQIVASPEGSNLSEREKIDDTVKKFKLLSRRNELFVLMISNIAQQYLGYMKTLRRRVQEILMSWRSCITLQWWVSLILRKETSWKYQERS